MNFSVRGQKFLIALVTLLLLGTGFISTGYALEITIKNQAQVTGDNIQLGEIALFFPAKDHRIAELRTVEIGSSPSPGNGYNFKKRLLQHKMRSLISKNDDVTFLLPESIHIRRNAQYVSRMMIQDIFTEYMLNNTQWFDGKSKLELTNIPRDMALPEGELSWKIQGRDGISSTGKRSATIEFFVDNKFIRKVFVSGRVKNNRGYIKATRRIKKGELLFGEDLVLSEETNRPFKDAFTETDQIIGKRAVRNIRPGQVITLQMVEHPPLVKKGTSVLIQAENKTIRITTLGKVLEDGRIGDHIKVVNLSSGKEIYATVKEQGLVEVTF